jgi:hypothetical protein
LGLDSVERRLEAGLGAHEGLYALEVFFGVYADGVVVGGFDVDGDAVFEEAELFEALGLFEEAVGQGGEALEGGFAVGVEADVLPVLRRDVVVCWCYTVACWCWVVGWWCLEAFCWGVAVVGDGGAGEVEGAAVGGGDDFDGVGVRDVLGGAEDFEGRDFDVRVGEGAEEGGEVLGFEERLVALDVDVDVGVDGLRDGVDAVGAAGQVGRGELDGPVVAVAEFGDLFGVGGDEDAVELGAGAGGVVDPGEHGASGEGAEDLAREAGGGQTGGDDAEDAQLLAGASRLFAAAGIKYDWRWLCRGERLLARRGFVPVSPYTHWRCSSDG